METETLKKKRIMRFSILFAIIIIILSFFSKTIAGLSLQKVTVAKGRMDYLEKEGTYEGTAAFKKTYKCFAPIESDVAKINVEAGDRVQKGQVLCSLMSSNTTSYDSDKKKLEIEKCQLMISHLQEQLNDYDSQISKAQDRLHSLDQKKQKTLEQRKAEAAGEMNNENEIDLQEAEKTLENNEALYKEGAISKTEVEAAKDAVEKLKLKIQSEKKAHEKEEAAEDESQQNASDTQEDILENFKSEKDKTAQSIEESKVNLKTLQLELAHLEETSTSGEIVAKEDGVVLAVEIDEGQHVQDKQEMMEIGSLSEGEKVSFTAEKDMKILSKGDEVELAIPAIDQSGIGGQVTSIKKENDSLNIEAAFNCEDVKGGESIEIHIKKEADEAHLLIPYCALNKEKKTYFVYVAEPEEDAMGSGYRIKKARVEIGEHSLDSVEIISGLNEESCVVVSSEKELQEGIKVKVENEEVFYDETNK